MAKNYKNALKELESVRDEWYMLPSDRVQASTAHGLYQLAYQQEYKKLPFWKFLIEYAAERLDIWKKDKNGNLELDSDGDPKINWIKLITSIWEVVAYLVTLWKFRNM